MKMLASALALVLIGLTGGWLWIDAAADAQHEAFENFRRGAGPESAKPSHEHLPSSMAL